MKKRKSTSLFSPQERAAQRMRHEALEERIRKAEAELVAKGSAYAHVPRGERLAFAIGRAEALAARPHSA
jgi:hypothetical protein